MKEVAMANKIEYTKSSGNIFEDLDYKNPQEHLVKVKLALRINQIIEKRKSTQADAAKVLGVNQPKISALANGRLDEFSIERLIMFLNKLDQDVSIYVHQKPKTRKTPAFFKVALG